MWSLNRGCRKRGRAEDFEDCLIWLRHPPGRSRLPRVSWYPVGTLHLVPPNPIASSVVAIWTTDVRGMQATPGLVLEQEIARILGHVQAEGGHTRNIGLAAAVGGVDLVNAVARMPLPLRAALAVVVAAMENLHVIGRSEGGERGEDGER